MMLDINIGLIKGNSNWIMGYCIVYRIEEMGYWVMEDSVVRGKIMEYDLDWISKY